MIEKMMAMWLLLILSTFFFFIITDCSAAVNQQQQQHKKNRNPLSFAFDHIGSSAIFPIRGNVYPDGYYYVTALVGNPPRPYYLDIDTGSDLTWIQCDAPCVRCSKAPHAPYKPNKNNIISCANPVCDAVHLEDVNFKCDDPNEQCDYEVEYADQALSLGVLMKDTFPLRLTNGSMLAPRLVFGCGYDQQIPHHQGTSNTDGVLGLGNGESSIISQLRKLGLTRNVIGHCISGRGGGYLFIGDNLVPSSGVAWTPMSQSKSSEKHYSAGPAELSYGAKSTGVKGLHVIFDSGSSYTYFNLQAYQALISSVRKHINGKTLKLVDDKELPVCWKGAKPFKSIQDVKTYFAPVSLSFGKKTQLVIPPEAYLIITSSGNVCLGILNGSEVELDDLNIIGDISLQDLLVVYDNEKHEIGWASKDCNRLPNVDDDGDDEDLFQEYTGNHGILSELGSTREEL